ncbi:MAG: iron-containing alcohol dehydrogenase [Clostridiales bacterium]|nr:iron-containing alcohol dehydrogenase [Clostridiales bacterium]
MMGPFELYLPTKLIFGAGGFSRLGTEAKAFGKTVLLVKTEGPLEGLGVYAKAAAFLEEAGLRVVTLEGVEENPKLRFVYEGERICREENVDLIVAVGGGSAIDCAKAIAAAAANEGDIWDYFEAKKTISSSLPVGAVSTIAATGAELSVHCVITNEGQERKLAIHNTLNLPRFAIIDPQLQATLPRRATACGMTDIISHVSESYFENEGQLLSDRFAEGIVQTVFDCEKVLDDPGNLDLRGELAWASIWAICGITDAGRSSYVYGAHEIAHGVAAVHDTVHGATLAVLHPAWLHHMLASGLHPDKYAQFAVRVMGMTGGAPGEKGIEAPGEKGIEALKEKYISWGMPRSLKELGVSEDRLKDIADSTVSNPISPLNDSREVLEVLESCFDI